MVILLSLLCLGTLIFGTLILMALVFLMSVVDEPKPDIQRQMSSIRGQAWHTAHRLSEEFLQLAIELLNEKRKQR